MGAHSGPKILADNYTVRVFTSSGIFNPAFSGTIEVLVVAGGGGGGMDMGGGGGGGGVISNTSFSVTAGTPLTVTVGAGGFGGPAGSGGYRTDGAGPQPGGHQFTVSATNGSNSVFGSLTAVGGGYGGSSYFGYTPNNGYGNAGGSGGGASGYSDGNTGRQGTGTAGQGNDGGGSTGQYYSGGGGGAAAAGSNGGTPNGGAGVLNSILDLPLYWGGGGGGASYSSGQGGNGGIGGGGGGANGTTTGGAGYNNGSPGGGGGGGMWAQTPGGNGGQYTGGGGGGGSHYNATNKGGEGGSGIVIVRYLSSLGNSTGGSPLGQSPLKFMIDMGNTLKSWRGPPITNLVPNPFANWNGSNFVFPNYNYDATGTHTFTYVTGVSNPVGAPGVMQYTTGTTGYKYWSIQSTVATTGTHAFSYYARIVSGPGPSSTLSNEQLWRSNGVDQSISGNWNPTYTTQWVRYTTTGPCTGSTLLDYFPIHGGSIAGGYTIQYCGFQLELGTYATPFVAGTRSSTQSLVDLTRRNTVTTSGLTYASNGIFSFSGGTNYVEVTNNDGFGEVSTTPNMSIEMWANVTRKSGGGVQYQHLAGFRNEASFNFFFLLLDSSGGTVNTEARLVTTSGVYDISADYTSYFNTWAHIVFIANANRTDLYINGILVGSNTSVAGSFGSTSGNFRIGLTPSGAFAANGRIDLVKVYNKALTAAEVQQNFNAKRGRFGI